MFKTKAPTEILHDLQVQLVNYPDLLVHKESENVIISGKLPVRGSIFEVKVVLDKNFPISFPKIYETAKRIPIKPWCHMYLDGSCCLCVEFEQRKYFPIGAPISDYFEKLVIPFLENRLHFEITGRYIKERKHNLAGIIDAYGEAFGTKDGGTIFQMLKVIAEGNLKGHHLCECGSGKRRRNCHGPVLWEVAIYVSKQQALRDLNKFIEAVKQL